MGGYCTTDSVAESVDSSFGVGEESLEFADREIGVVFEPGHGTRLDARSTGSWRGMIEVFDMLFDQRVDFGKLALDFTI